MNRSIDEASLHTVMNGAELELRLPQTGEYTPMMKFLAAVMTRAEEDFGWWDTQVRWYENWVKQKTFHRTRVQLKLVKRPELVISDPVLGNIYTDDAAVDDEEAQKERR